MKKVFSAYVPNGLRLDTRAGVAVLVGLIVPPDERRGVKHYRVTKVEQTAKGRMAQIEVEYIQTSVSDEDTAVKETP